MEVYWYIYSYDASDGCVVSDEQDMISMVEMEVV